ncbi:hypothetical protein, partial [Streptomyces yangpuensis]|uniref:hypothetical protein n=1 Tax=Streptomyces yangpuensis TaxID=1648182 RepID=UPI00369F07A9
TALEPWPGGAGADAGGRAFGMRGTHPPAVRGAPAPPPATERDLPESADRPATRDCCRRE